MKKSVVNGLLECDRCGNIIVHMYRDSTFELIVECSNCGNYTRIEIDDYFKIL